MEVGTPDMHGAEEAVMKAGVPENMVIVVGMAAMAATATVTAPEAAAMAAVEVDRAMVVVEVDRAMAAGGGVVDLTEGGKEAMMQAKAHTRNTVV